MKKIPTIFERDWNGDRSRVVNQIHAGCEWVAAGEGVATRKMDGTSCLVRDGKLYKRRELKQGDAPPLNFEVADQDGETGKTVGWIPVDTSPENRWHLEAFKPDLADGTYELMGPKVQGNPERFTTHILYPHRYMEHYADVPRDFEGLKDWLNGNLENLFVRDIEGLVFHHADGRMAKIKLRDYGLKRGRVAS